jgi:hypothetical protein
MAKTRMLKHDLRTSEKVATWPIEIRYFWVLLWGYVDDHGKGKDTPLLVKADCFPLDPNITAETIDGWLWHLETEGVIARYTAGEHNLIAVIHWTEHQKPPHPTKDILPGPDDSESIRRELHASCMKDAGTTHASCTPVLGLGLGLSKGLGLGSDAHLTAGVTFSDFWDAWPKSNGKKAAEAAWDKAIKRASPEAIVQAAIDYATAPHRPAIQFVPYGATWLNGDLWEDDLPQAPEAERKPTRTDQNLDFVQDLYRQQEDHNRQLGIAQ